jgi:hypothetical protein
MKDYDSIDEILVFFAKIANGLITETSRNKYLEDNTAGFKDPIKLKAFLRDLENEILGEDCEYSEGSRNFVGNNKSEDDFHAMHQFKMRQYNSVKDFLQKHLDQIVPDSNNEKVEKEYNTKIFTSYSGFQIFEAFKNNIVLEATEYADYSFLFTKLLKDEFIHKMGHKKFIDFLGDEHQVKFAKDYIQFKYSETKIKNDAYSRYKQQFK